jgi:hypothetical protein
MPEVLRAVCMVAMMSSSEQLLGTQRPILRESTGRLSPLIGMK